MSEDPTPQADSTSPQSDSNAAQSEPASPGAGKKPRSPVERVIVWGGIIVLLLLVAVQAHARKGYEWTLEALQPLVDDDFEGAVPLAIADVEQHVVGFPSQSENVVSPTRTERVYRWRGLRGSYGITLAYNPAADTSVVTSLVTDGAPEPEAPVYDDSADGEASDLMAGMPGGGGSGPSSHDAEGGGPGGERGQFNPMDDDADGDGMLSRDEVSERMLEGFDDNDANSDGFLDAAEIEAMRARMREMFGGGRGDGEDRPQRPSAEEPGDSSPAETTTDGEPAPEEAAPAEDGDDASPPAESAPAEFAPAESGEEETAESP
jgi:hypothetical protein